MTISAEPSFGLW